MGSTKLTAEPFLGTQEYNTLTDNKFNAISIRETNYSK